MQKCYNITVTGKVQNMGFRSVVEYAGRMLALSGLVFNARNGSVRIICCGEEDVIGDFFQEIRTRGEQRGAVIEDIKEQEMPFIDLPDTFSRLFTDDDIDTGRKLDKGNDLLTDIKADTSAIRGDTSVLPEIKMGIDNLNVKFDSFITEQKEHNQWMKDHLIKMDEHNIKMDEHNIKMDEHNQWMKEHNQRLEKILEKLAER